MNTDDKSAVSTRMSKTLDALKSQFATVRAGRANPAVLDQISVDYYGQPTPIAQIATVAVPDPRSITIQPWDAAQLRAIEKAIQISELGINPSNDGKLIRLAFPQLTEERRKELVKQVKNYGEEGKVAIRNIRRDLAEKLKAQKKKSEITEDDLKDSEKDLQKLTDDFIKLIDEMEAEKERELYEI